jgi:hypothetical protein
LMAAKSGFVKNRFGEKDTRCRDEVQGYVRVRRRREVE